mmetsp:Transcript_50817/g.95294  ORF Transcript_50817/g.95294 Transcript_50817/m.95294 type:complete len:222 (+) Transcript_50817:489-1154(+)
MSATLSKHLLHFHVVSHSNTSTVSPFFLMFSTLALVEGCERTTAGPATWTTSYFAPVPGSRNEVSNAAMSLIFLVLSICEDLRDVGLNCLSSSISAMAIHLGFCIISRLLVSCASPVSTSSHQAGVRTSIPSTFMGRYSSPTFSQSLPCRTPRTMEPNSAIPGLVLRYSTISSTTLSCTAPCGRTGTMSNSPTTSGGPAASNRSPSLTSCILSQDCRDLKT